MESFRIGRSYYTGTRNFTKNHEIAFIYLTESIAKGYDEAGRYLGDLYFSRDVVEVDKEYELRLYEKSTINLNEWELINIGQTYYTKEWYSIAAVYLIKSKGSDPTMLRHLGDLHYEGKGVEKKTSHEKALRFHKISASLLTNETNYNIGLEYFNASSQSKQNVEAGLVYINEAIYHGSSTATRFIVDKYYYGGDGIDQDQARALKLHKTLADARYPTGRYWLKYNRLRNF